MGVKGRQKIRQSSLRSGMQHYSSGYSHWRNIASTMRTPAGWAGTQRLYSKEVIRNDLYELDYRGRIAASAHWQNNKRVFYARSG